MGYVKHLQAEVGEDGKVTVHLPDLKEGQRVEVTITADEKETPPGTRKLAWLKGKVRVMSNFDDPIPGIEDYC